MFSPDDDLYYIYFKEKNSDFRSTRQSKATLFGVSGIDDLQRGFRLNEDILDFYPFFGFSQSIRLNSAINSLKSQSEHVDISSIQKLELNDDSSEDESSNSHPVQNMQKAVIELIANGLNPKETPSIKSLFDYLYTKVKVRAFNIKLNLKT